jgi:uncharacterized membrane protein
MTSARGTGGQVDTTMADLISWTLISGVALSALLMIAGVALFAITGQTGYSQGTSLEALLAAKDGLPTSPGDILRDSISLKPFAIIQLGALVLIATPVFRVAASAVVFALERDRLYTAITLAVLLLLLASLFWVG